MKLLLISYYYPPLGGAGVQRALKFSKYLGDFGVQPVVLAAHDPHYAQDPSLLAEVPAGVRVLRIEDRPLLQRMLAARSPTATSAAARPAADSRWRGAALSAWASLNFPDDRATWARRAAAPARAVLREGIDAIFSTAPPMSAHWLAAKLAAESGLPWVADYRDLWADNPGYAAPAWRRALDRRAEARWLQAAAGIVTVTPSWRERFASRHRVPVAFIPNGYDEADFAALRPAPRRADAFTLVHTGSFYGPRDPGALLDGLALYLHAAPAGARPLRLRLVGQMGSRFAARLARFEADHAGVVEQRPYLPHADALAEMVNADALLLVVGAGSKPRHAAVAAGTLPGKLFEYLRAGPPIVLLGDPRGDAAAILRDHGRGWVADETQPAQIAQALQRMLAAPAAAASAGADVAVFERRALSGQLAAFLRRCAGRSDG